MSFLSKHFYKKFSGFTLVEMLVSIGIMLLIISVVVMNQSKYTSVISLNNQADEISLRLSEAQAYGVGVKESNTGSGIFNIAYGLSFSQLLNPGGSNTSYIIFADLDNDRIYGADWTCPSGGECLEKVNIINNNSIQSICAIRIGVADDCQVGRVDISFLRPYTIATLKFFNLGGDPFDPGQVMGVRVTLTNTSGNTRSVGVYTTGQISVQ